MPAKTTKTEVRFKCTAKCKGCGRVCNATEHVKVTTTMPTTKAGWTKLLSELGPEAIKALGAAVKALL